ncbi:MAG: class I SAM-dependent methyltransferase [Frankia sp.]
MPATHAVGARTNRRPQPGLDRSTDGYFSSVAEGWVENYRGSASFRSRLAVVGAAISDVLGAVPASPDGPGAGGGATVLDFGGGPGVFSAVCSSRARTVIDLDPSLEMLRAGASRAGLLAELADCPVATVNDRVARVAGSLDSVTARCAGRFDLVLAIAVLEYLSDPAWTVAALGRLLRPDGALLLTVPRPASVFRRLERATEPAAAWSARHSSNERVAGRGHTALRPYGDAVPWREDLARAGLVVEEIRPIPLGDRGWRRRVSPNDLVVLRRRRLPTARAGEPRA